MTFYGLRAIFIGYSIDASTGEWEGAGLIGGDALSLSFSPSNWVYHSTLRPSTSILFFIAGLFALFLGILALFKVIHDLIDLQFGIATKEREDDLQQIAALSSLNRMENKAISSTTIPPVIAKQQQQQQSNENIGSLALSAGVSPTLVAAFGSSSQQQRGGGGSFVISGVSRFIEPSVRLVPVVKSNDTIQQETLQNVSGGGGGGGGGVSIVSIQQHQSPLSSDTAPIDYSVGGLSKLFGFNTKLTSLMASPTSLPEGGVALRSAPKTVVLPDTMNPAYKHLQGGTKTNTTLRKLATVEESLSSSSSSSLSREGGREGLGGDEKEKRRRGLGEEKDVD